MSLSALVTFTTLTVVLSAIITSQAINVSIVNYTNVSSLFFSDDSNVAIDVNTVNNGVSPFLSRLIAVIAFSLNILLMVAIAPAANYSLEFSAPSLSYVNVLDNITAVINRVVNYISSLSEGFIISFLAFIPQNKMLTDSGVDYAYYQEFVNTYIRGTSEINSSVFYYDRIAVLQLNYTESNAYI
jgi:hypothetical protein